MKSFRFPMFLLIVGLFMALLLSGVTLGEVPRDNGVVYTDNVVTLNTATVIPGTVFSISSYLPSMGLVEQKPNTSLDNSYITDLIDGNSKLEANKYRNEQDVPLLYRIE